MVRLLAALVALCIAMPGWAATVQLRVPTTELQVGQSVLIGVAVTNGTLDAVPAFSEPQGLRIAYERSEISNRTALVQGHFVVRRTTSYVYKLTALSEGSYTLGPVTLELHDEADQSTRAVTVKVGPRIEAANTSLAAEAQFDTSTAWEGQVVVYHYMLRNRTRILRSSWSLPDFEGLVAPRDGNRPRTQIQVEDPDGAVAIDTTWIPLVITGTGTLDQPVALVQVDLPNPAGQRRSPFGNNPFGANRRQEVLATEPAALRSRPLPAAPDDYSGLVGDFEFHTRLDKEQAAVGESVIWTVIVQGDGTLEGFSLPDPGSIENAQLYDNGPRVGAAVIDGKYVSKGEFERVLVPTEQGDLHVPDLMVTVFSPSEGRYITHEVPVGDVVVVPGTEAAANVISFPMLSGSGPVEHKAEGIRPIWRSGSNTVVRLSPWLHWLLALAALPGLVLLSLIGRERVEQQLAARRAVTGPTPPLERLSSLPADPEQRLAIMDGALRDAVGQGAPDDALQTEIEAVRRLLNRARFAGDAGAGLEEKIRVVIEQLEAA